MRNFCSITPNYKIPTCQQVHIGYSFIFCSFRHQLLLVREVQITRHVLYSQSSYYKIDLNLCNLENAVLQTSNQRKKSEKKLNVFCQTLSEATTFLLPLCQHYQCDLLQDSFATDNNNYIDLSTRFKVRSCQIPEAA